MKIKEAGNKKKVYIIHQINGASEEEVKKVYKYTEKLENEGCDVHLPIRDTVQDTDPFSICDQNKQAIVEADEIHAFFTDESKGSLFDLGMAFYAGKPLFVVENYNYKPHVKSFPLLINMIDKGVKY